MSSYHDPGTSAWTTPLPAVIHCTSPGPPAKKLPPKS